MNLFQRSFSLLRTWLGLGDPSDEHLTPNHGWLLPTAEVVLERRTKAAAAAEPRLP